MHRIWRIPELATEIFKQLQRGDLARLARSCRSVFVLASPLLWNRITDNELCWLYQCITDPEAPDALQGEVQRWELYTQSVRHLTIGSRTEYHLDLVDLATMAFIKGCHESRCLLPFLTSMELALRDDIEDCDLRSAITVCTTFLSSQLKTLCVEARLFRKFSDGHAKHLGHFLHMLRVSCPFLVELTISGLLAEWVTAPLVDALCAHLPHLRLLENFSGGAWIHNPRIRNGLAELPALKQLVIKPVEDEAGNLDVADYVNVPTMGSSDLLHEFRCLCRLDVSARLSDCTDLFNSLSHLRDVQLTTWQDTSHVSLGKIIGDRCTYLERMNWTHRSPASVHMFRDNLFGLLPCRKLTDLVFYFDPQNPLSLDDADVSRIVKSWPLLRIFKLPYVTSSMTFQSLASFASHCPSLKSLSLKISTGTSILVPPAIQASNQELTLWLILSTELPAIEAAKFIYGLWPNVRIRTLASGPEIETLIERFQALATDEGVSQAVEQQE